MAAPSAERSWLLAIDTSSPTVSIAVGPCAVDGELQVAEMSWFADRRQTTTLLDQIDRLLQVNGLETANLGGLAVAVGPGGFSSLRVGLATAKGICLAHELPIYGIGTLDATAAQFEGWGKPVRALVHAGRSRVVAGDYRPGLHGLTLAAALEHRTYDDLAEGLSEPTLLVGDLPDRVARTYRDHERVVLLPESTRQRRASILVGMAQRRIQANASDDLASLEPIYVHRSATKRAG